MNTKLKSAVASIGQLLENSTVLPSVDTSFLDSYLLEPDGRMRLHPAKYYSAITPANLAVWCNKNARYGIPTTELIAFLRRYIGDRSAIEIGAGHGDLGYHLGIPMTDSKLQDRPDVALYYAALNQPRIKYPADVQTFEAIDAINHFKPKVVIASWLTQKGNETIPQSCTWGCNEQDVILHHEVEAYVFIGNTANHGLKNILKFQHREFKPHWLKSRSLKPTNVIWIWERNEAAALPTDEWF